MLISSGSDSTSTAVFSDRFWRIISYTLACLVLIPLLVIFSSWSNINLATWSHLNETLLASLLSNTLLLISASALVSVYWVCR